MSKQFLVFIFLLFYIEVDGVFQATNSTDWWSFGALLFELLTGEVSLHTYL